eukprot:GHUV01053172.1.p1 GENE.GHUV01053172.1~~GHUV01053172.1.p1  ORF type:complete len:138 (+),score=27.26 GHUV01053172.1:204-617(+)
MTQQSFAALVAAGDFGSAVKVLDGAIDETRQDYAAALYRLVQLHINRGYCNQKLNLNRKALKDYDAALALMPSNITALLRKGQVLQSLGKHAVRMLRSSSVNNSGCKHSSGPRPSVCSAAVAVHQQHLRQSAQATFS